MRFAQLVCLGVQPDIRRQKPQHPFAVLVNLLGKRADSLA
jgi:hypothetical protein